MFSSSWEPTALFRRDFAWRALESWLPKGASTNDVYNATVDAKLGIRRQDFLRIASDVREYQFRSEKIRAQNRDQLIPAANYQGREWQLTSTYTYQVEVFGRNPTTGDDEIINRLIGSDDRLSPNELEGIVRELGEPTSDSLALEIGGVQPYGVIVRTDFFR